MSWICNDCGAVFEAPEKVILDGEPWGRCPSCGSEDYEEAKECELCGETIQESDVYGYDHCICQKCLGDNSQNLRLLLKATANEMYDVPIPALARYILSDADITALLEKELARRCAAASATEWQRMTERFLRDYRNDIADELGEEVDHGEL